MCVCVTCFGIKTLAGKKTFSLFQERLMYIYGGKFTIYQMFFPEQEKCSDTNKFIRYSYLTSKDNCET